MKKNLSGESCNNNTLNSSGNNNNSFHSYLTIHPKAKEWPLYCVDAGFTDIPPYSEYPPQKNDHPKEYLKNFENGRILNEYRLVYITSGMGHLVYNNTKHPISGGTAFLLKPGITHHYCPDIYRGWQEYWVGFNGTQAYELLESRRFDFQRYLFNPGLQSDLLTTYQEIFETITEHPPKYQLVLGGLILKLLGRLLSADQAKKIPEKPREIVEKVRFRLSKDVYNELNIEQLCRHEAMSYSKLNRLFKEYTGMSIYRFFLQLKINKAKELLLNPEATVKEVAYKLSFENPEYLSLLFKKKTGVTPTKWRKSNNIL